MLIKNTLQDLYNYLEDTSNLKGKANKLYIPESKEELTGVLKEHNNSKTPLTVCAGKTGTTAGCVALEGNVVSLEKLNAIRQVDEKNKTIKLEAGVLVKDLTAQAAKYNLALRASPTEPLAFIGGTVSTCASGVRGFGWGSIRNYVLAIEIILPQSQTIRIKRGEIFARGRSFDFTLEGKNFSFSLPSYIMPPGIKSQAGYFAQDNMDLIDLFIGSEGTLGVITECQISLQAQAACAFDGLLFFGDEAKALYFVKKIKELKTLRKILPTSLEFFDTGTLGLLRDEYAFIPAEAVSAVYFEQETENKEEYTGLLEKWDTLINESEAMPEAVIVAETPRERQKIFDFRHRVPQAINEFLRNNNQVKSASDIAVPAGKFDEMFTFYKRIAQSCGLRYASFGHIGESHLHFNFLPVNDSQSAKAKECIRVFCRKAVSLGGTVSAEHGIGKIKKDLLEIMYGRDKIQEMARVKKYFDPNCILNLDNIFSRELLKTV